MKGDLEHSQHRVADAFSVILEASRQQNSVSFPKELIVKNKQDQLFNDIMAFLKSRSCVSGIQTKSEVMLPQSLFGV